MGYPLHEVGNLVLLGTIVCALSRKIRARAGPSIQTDGAENDPATGVGHSEYGPALLLQMTAPYRTGNGIYIIQLLRALSFLTHATHLLLFPAVDPPVQ
jgi:hypothetical protein